MGRQNAPLGQVVQARTMLAQGVQRIGVDDHRRLARAYLLQHGVHRLRVASQAGTDTHGLIVVRIGRLGEARLAVVQLGHGLGYGRLHHEVVAEGNMHGQQPRARAQTAAGGEDGCARHALRTGDEQRTAEVALVGEASARTEQGGHLVVVGQLEVGVRLVDSFLAQADVQQAPFTDIGFVLGKEESQLGQLQAQGQVGADDVGCYIIGIVLAHQARRHVNGYHMGGRGVDILHHGGKPSAQRFVQPAAEEAVHHHVVCRQCGRGKLGGDFMESDAFHFEKAFTVHGTVFGKLSLRVEKEDFQPIALSGHQSCHGQGIAPVVARSGEYGKGSFGVGPLLHDGVGQRPCGPLHQVDGGNGLVLDGIGIQLADARSRKYFHNACLQFSTKVGIPILFRK